MIRSLPLCASLILSAADWPQFRGPNATGVADDIDLPIEFGPDKNVVWKTAVPRGHSSPSVAGNKIFLTAFEGEKILTGHHAEGLQFNDVCCCYRSTQN